MLRALAPSSTRWPASSTTTGGSAARADPDDALARADDDEAADGLTRAPTTEAVAEGEKRGAYGYTKDFDVK